MADKPQKAGLSHDTPAPASKYQKIKDIAVSE